MRTKKCNFCKKCFSINNFNKNHTKKDGLSAACRECNKKHSRAYYLKNRKSHIKFIIASRRKIIYENTKKIFNYLLSHPCIDCGESDPLVIDFDHVRGKKIDNIGEFIGRACPWGQISKEMKKCVSRCSNCHRRITARRQKTWRWKIIQGQIHSQPRNSTV
jgi:hypothetical protein